MTTADPTLSRRHGLAQRAAALWRDGLVHNSAYLMANMIVAAGFGFVFFAILARLYAPSQVGLVTTAMSSTLLVTSLSALGMNYSLVRFLPPAEPREKAKLLNSALLLVAAATMVVTTAFLLIPGASSELFALGGAGFVLAFFASNLLNSLKTVGESVFVAERSARTVLTSNVASNVTKIGLPFALLSLGAIGAYWANAGALLVGLVALSVAYRRRYHHRFRLEFDGAAVRRIASFSFGNYLSGLVGGVPAMVLPLIVLSRFGADQAAYWYTAMMVATLIFALPGSIGQSLLAEGSHRPTEWRALASKSARMMALIMGPVIAFTIFVAPLVLQLIGDEYKDGALTPMRLLVLSGVLVSINYVAGTLLYLAKKVWLIAAVNVINLTISIGIAVSVAQSTTDVALGWLLGEVVNVVLFCIAARHVLRNHVAEEEMA